MELKYNLKEQDYVDFNVYRITTAEANRKSILMNRFLMPCIFLVIACIFLVVSFFKPDASSTSRWLPFGVFGTFALIWIYAYPRRLKTRVKKQVKDLMNIEKNKGFVGEQTLKILKTGIMVTNGSGESKLSWKGILHIAETRKQIFIFDSAISSYIVPLNAFKTDEEKQEFLDLLRAKSKK